MVEIRSWENQDAAETGKKCVQLTAKSLIRSDRTAAAHVTLGAATDCRVADSQ